MKIVKESKVKKLSVMIIGASSYVGSRLFYDLFREYKIIGTFFKNRLVKDFVHLDVTDYDEVQSLISESKPSVIIHVANNANAGWCEKNPKEAILLNQTATRYVVEGANKVGAKVVYISSYAAINPSEEIYSETKRTSERLVKDTERGYLVLRPSLIIGFSPNSVNDHTFNRIIKQIDEKKAGEFDTSWRFQPTYIRQLSEVIDLVIKHNNFNETVSVAIDEIKSQFEIASDIMSHFSLTPKPKDMQLEIPTIREDLSRLEQLGITSFMYDEVIKEIADDIKSRDKYKL